MSNKISAWGRETKDGQFSTINPKTKIKFMGREFEVYEYSLPYLLIYLTGLMVCGKEYYDMLKSADIQLGDDELWGFIVSEFEDKGD